MFKTYIMITATLFAIVAVGHLARIMLSLPVDVGGLNIPMWVSWLGMVVPGSLSAWGFMAGRKV